MRSLRWMRPPGMGAVAFLLLQAPVEAADAPADVMDYASSTGASISEIVVSASHTAESVEKQEVERNPGGGAIISSADVDLQKASNTADLLDGQPGILAQSNNGGEATRLSIRGSGIQRAASAYQQGINVLQNGLSLRTSSGFPYETIDPLTYSHVEVLRGDSAFDYGPQTIGGMINYVTYTGYNAPSVLQARSEAGSFGYVKEQLSSGTVLGPFDYYASLTDYRYSGFRDNSTARSTRAILNLGYKITPDISTRVFLLSAQQYQENPGNLTWAQLQSTPTLSQYPQIRNRQNPSTFNLGDTTTIRINSESSLEVALVYLIFPNYNPGGPAPTQFAFRDLDGSIRYRLENRIFGLNSKTTVGFISNNQLYGDERYQNGSFAYLGKAEFEAKDSIAIVSNELGLTDRLWLTTGAAYLAQHRAAIVSFPITGAIRHTYSDAAGRAGLRYEITPNWSVYGQYGRVVEAPYSSGYPQANAQNIVTSLLDLKSQPANTAEVGTRGSWGAFSWDLDVYRSWIKNELITVLTTPTTSATANATPTVHSGIESALTTVLWQGGDVSDWHVQPSGSLSSAQLVLRQAYTLNHYNYENDPLYGTNTLAGLPREVYEGELRFEHPSGFYVEANVESVLTKYPVDYANTFYARAYAIYGAVIGYSQKDRGWSVFLQGDNLGNKRYASIVSPIFTASGKDSAVFTPGAPRRVSAGISYRL